MRTDRPKDLDRYYNDHLKLRLVRRLMLVNTWSEIMGIQSAIFQALDRENQAEQKEQKEFQAWKAAKEKKQFQPPTRASNGPGFFMPGK